MVHHSYFTAKIPFKSVILTGDVLVILTGCLATLPHHHA
jgi:hypothetical protein